MRLPGGLSGRDLAGLKPYPEMRDSGVEWLGKVPEHWRVRRLKGLVEILNGATPVSGRSEYWSGDILWITPEDLGRLPGRNIHSSRRSITRIGYESCGTMLAPAGSTVMSTRAPIGHLAILGREGCTNQGCRLLVPLEDALIPEWAYMGLLTARSELQTLGQGTTFAELSRDALGAFSLPLPSLPEQTGIVRFLDHVDWRIRRYIHAKERLIKLLEERKRAMIHQTVTGQIDVRTGKPYPAYKDSEIDWLVGKVPKHWEVRRLKTLSSMRSGDSITAMSIDQAGEYPVYGGNGLRGYTSKYTHDGHFALVGRQGALCGNVHLAHGRFWASEHAVVATLREGHVLDWFGALLMVMNLNQYSIAAAQPGLSVDRVLNLWVPIPPLEEQRSIATHLVRRSSGLRKTVAATERQISLLREYHNRLIADVVTGKLDVREAAANLPVAARLAGGNRNNAVPFDQDTEAGVT